MIERTDAVEEHGEAFNEAHDEAPTDAALLAEARRLILKHLPSPGVRLTDVPGLALYHVASNDFIERNAGELLVSFIVSGRKATAVGDRVLEYGPGQSLVCGIASPTEFHTLDASPESPFLALAVSLDTAILMEYAAAIGLKASDSNPDDDSGGVFVIRPDVDLARAFLRLLRLLERPALVAVRAPLALRDLHALLLDSKEAATLRDLAIAGSVGHAVSAAAEWLRRNGFMILECNWRCGRYEIDIIATRYDTIHFIEVKTRKAGGWTTPEQAISPAKCRALFRGAEAFLAMSGTKLEPQFDLMAVDMFDENDCDIRYIENAMQSHW